MWEMNSLPGTRGALQSHDTEHCVLVSAYFTCCPSVFAEPRGSRKRWVCPLAWGQSHRWAPRVWSGGLVPIQGSRECKEGSRRLWWV